MRTAHVVDALGVPEEELELQHLVQPVPPPLPHLLQVGTLTLQVGQAITNLREGGSLETRNRIEGVVYLFSDNLVAMLCTMF